MGRRLPIFLPVLLLILAACQAKDAGQAGRMAPDFRADDLTGRTVYLNAELKRPVVLTFFATWCVPCRDEVPLLIDLHRRFGERVGFLCVAVDPENVDKIRSFVHDLQVPYPMLLDSDRKIMSAYGVEALPATFVIGTDGRIRSVFSRIGEQEAQSLADELTRLLEAL